MDRRICTCLCERCKDCPHENKSVKSDGSMYGIEYMVVEEEKKRYLIVKENSLKEYANLEFTEYVPKYGKYEFEQFIAHKFKEALFITHEITDLFNTYMSCTDFYFGRYSIMKVGPERIKEELMKCFDIVEENDNIVRLKFKGIPYSKLKDN